MTAPSTTSCLHCRHFEHSPAALEAALPGLSSLSSAYAAVLANDLVGNTFWIKLVDISVSQP